MEATTITIRYRSCDGASETRHYKTLKGAMRWAHERVGPHPEIGRNCAISGNGIGRVIVTGCSLKELFPEA